MSDSPLDRDPVCGMTVKPDAAHRTTFGVADYRFCSNGCREKFDADPRCYAAVGQVDSESGQVQSHGRHGWVESHSQCPCTQPWFSCGAHRRLAHKGWVCRTSGSRLRSFRWSCSS